MARTTAPDVIALTGTSMLEPQVLTWVTVASKAIDKRESDIGADEETLALIELNLAAHFIALLNPGEGGAIVTSERVEQLQTSFATQSNIADTINTTVYGQAANTLSDGILASGDDVAASVEFFC